MGYFTGHWRFLAMLASSSPHVNVCEKDISEIIELGSLFEVDDMYIYVFYVVSVGVFMYRTFDMNYFCGARIGPESPNVMVRSAGDPEDVYIGTLFGAKLLASSKKNRQMSDKNNDRHFFRFFVCWIPVDDPFILEKKSGFVRCTKRDCNSESSDQNWMRISWANLVGGLEHLDYFSINWE